MLARKFLNSKVKVILENSARIKGVSEPFSSENVAEFFALIEENKEAEALMEQLLSKSSMSPSLIDKITDMVFEYSLQANKEAV